MIHNHRILTQHGARRAILIDQDDMLHIVWSHATLRMNLTGLVHLLRYLEADYHPRPEARVFEITGNLDDGFVLWVQDVALRLDTNDYLAFRNLIKAAVDALQPARVSTRMPEWLRDTNEVAPPASVSLN